MVESRQHPSEEQSPKPARLDLDDLIHQPVRLSIMAMLAYGKRVDFALLRDQLLVSDSNLSRHLTALEEAEYIVIEKVFEGKRPRTWLELTPQGRKAFESHVAALRRIVDHE